MAEIYGFAINVEGNAVKGITAIDQSLNRLNTDASKSTESIFGGFLKANVAMRAFDASIAGMKSVYNLGVQTEQTRIAFDTMLGSAEKGGAMFQSLKQWADITPFDNDTAYQAGKMLLNYGVSAKDVLPYMNMLGDASGGVKERFDRMIYAFAQVRAMGRLQGQDLRQLIDAGFNPLQTISEKTGTSMAVLKDRMEKGQISFDMVVNAFKSATSEGGRFFGMMQSQSQTVGGLESTLAGNLQTAAYGIFQRMAPGLKEVLSGSIEVAKSFADWVTPKQSEILSQQRIEMNALFNVLKDGNLPLDQRHELMAKLNTSYKDFIDKQITDKTTLAELNKLQGESNQKMLEKIKIAAQQEVLSTYFKKAADAQKLLMETEIKAEEARISGKTFMQGYGPGAKAVTSQEYFQPILLNAQKQVAKSQNDLQKALGYLSMGGVDFKNSSLTGLQQTAFDKIGSGSATSPTEPFTKSALGTSEMGKAGGGLGEAKQINIRIDKLMEVNAQAYDGEDMKADASKAVEEITRIIKNMSYGQGLM